LKADVGAIRAAARQVSPARGTRIPIFGAFLIRVAPGAFSIEAQNGQVHFGATVPIASDGVDGVSIVVPGRQILRFLDTLPADDPMQIEMDRSGALVLASGDSELSVPHLDLHEWPVDLVRDGQSVSASYGVLRSIASTAFAASTDPDRGALVGVHLHSNKATALDQARLAQATLSIDLPTCTIPSTFIGYPVKHVGEESVVEVTVTASSARVAVGDDFWQCQLVAAEFPDASRLLHLPTIACATFDRQELATVLERLDVLDGVDAVQIRVGKTNAGFLAGSEHAGFVRDRVVCMADSAQEVRFRLSHLREAVTAVAEPVVEFKFRQSPGPLLIESENLVQIVSTMRA